MSQERPFLAFPDGENAVYINTALIRRAVLAEDGSLVIWFSETHKEHFEGAGAMAVAARLADSSLALNGEPLKHLDISLTASPEDQPQES